jgi:hypothetical protein
MNKFTKSKIKSTLDYKVSVREILSYQLTDTSLYIKKSKRCGHTITFDQLEDHLLIRLVQKNIPDPGILNTSEFFKRELRDLKIKNLLN